MQSDQFVKTSILRKKRAGTKDVPSTTRANRLIIIPAGVIMLCLLVVTLGVSSVQAKKNSVPHVYDDPGGFGLSDETSYTPAFRKARVSIEDMSVKKDSAPVLTVKEDSCRYTDRYFRIALEVNASDDTTSTKLEAPDAATGVVGYSWMGTDYSAAGTKNYQVLVEHEPQIFSSQERILYAVKDGEVIKDSGVLRHDGYEYVYIRTDRSFSVARCLNNQQLLIRFTQMSPEYQAKSNAQLMDLVGRSSR